MELLQQQADEIMSRPVTPPPPPSRGWKGRELVESNGDHWPLDFAAKLLQLPERDLRDLVRIVGHMHPGALEPSGTIRMAAFRRQGRHPRAYPGSKLLMLVEGLADLCEELASA